jgi:DNA mismatch repair protein MutS2
MKQETIQEVIRESLDLLELSGVLEEVAVHAQSVPGGEHVRASLPLEDVKDITRVLRLVEELREIIRLDGLLGLGGLVPLEGVLARLQSPVSILDVEEILAVNDVLATGSTVHARLSHLEERYSVLREESGQLAPQEWIRSRINQVLDERGEIRPSASPKLRQIRDRMRSVRSLIIRRLESVVQSDDLSRVVQEDYVTVRSDRYVILLKPGFKGYLKGIVHDHSRSGASVYVEPLAVLDLNNQAASLVDEEREEIRRIFQQLTDDIRTEVDVLAANYEELGILDGYQARALFAIDTRSISPELTEKGFHIVGARHPLLLAASDVRVVPMEVVQDHSARATVISGANMGGKTVALKIAGLFPLMTRCGIPVPAAEGTKISPVARIMADIGDDQDIRGRVSSFSGHMTRIKAIVESAGAGDLVLLDELGGATDPEEGSALAMAVLDELLERGARVVVTTHLSQLKVYALSRPDVMNVSVEFHPTTLKPTFRLVYDMPGESHAIETAELIGLPAPVIAKARHYADRFAGGSSALIAHLRAKTTEADSLVKELSDKQALLDGELARIQAERDEIIEGVRREARETLRNAEKQINELQQAQKRKELTDAKAVRASLREVRLHLEEHLGVPLERKIPSPEVGSRVRLKSLGREGVVTQVLDKGKIDVAIGPLSFRAEVQDAELVSGPVRKKTTSKITQIAVESPGAQPRWEVNVIGLRADEALPIVERAIDDAVLGNLNSISIIHGKGTGRLKKAVREYLASHNLVRGFRPGDLREGGEGITVVDIVSE